VNDEKYIGLDVHLRAQFLHQLALAGDAVQIANQQNV
jgi:hypothetical protein